MKDFYFLKDCTLLFYFLIKNPVLVLPNFQDDIKHKLNKKKDRSMMIIYEIVLCNTLQNRNKSSGIKLDLRLDLMEQRL